MRHQSYHIQDSYGIISLLCLISEYLNLEIRDGPVHARIQKNDRRGFPTAKSFASRHLHQSDAVGYRWTGRIPLGHASLLQRRSRSSDCLQVRKVDAWLKFKLDAKQTYLSSLQLMSVDKPALINNRQHFLRTSSKNINFTS